MNFPITCSSDAGDIEQLQQALVDHGFEVARDGVLGPKTTAAVRAFQAAKALAVDGVVDAATWGRLTVSAPPPTPAPAPGAGPFAGFDTSCYPGDAAMQTWKHCSPYSFVGYYLKAPCHPNTEWMGKRARIDSMGWGVVVIYVGRQSQGPCSGTPPDRATGVADAQDALAKTASEGFPPQTIVYLDVEPMDHIPQAQIEYINGWLSPFCDARFLPGIYCHVRNANQLKGAIRDFPSEQVAFWVSGGGHFVAGTSRPANSGISFARIWQGAFNQTRSFGGVSIEIDENVAETT
jgi:hypothetical protein